MLSALGCRKNCQPLGENQWAHSRTSNYTTTQKIKSIHPLKRAKIQSSCAAMLSTSGFKASSQTQGEFEWVNRGAFN